MRRGIYYGWIMVAVTATMATVTAGTRAAPGAFLVAMEADTGFSRAALSVAAGLGILLYGLAGPLAGALMNRLRVRTVAAISVLATAATLVVTSISHEVWQFALFFGLITGISTGLVASSYGAMVANRWFVKYRGIVLGVFGASSSVGQLIFIPVLALLATQLGWRIGAVALAVITAAMIVPILLFIRDDPASMGLVPLGAPPGTTPSSAAAKQTADKGVMRRALKNPDFWLLAGTFFTCGATSNGLVGQHFIAHAVDHGFTTTVGASALGLIGLFNFVGVLGSGWLTDRFDPRRLLSIYYTFRGLSLLYVPFIYSTTDITIFSILFGLDYFATVPPTVALTADRFGRNNVGVVYGWIFASHMLGGAIAAVSAGAIRDAFGDYAPAFFLGGSVAILGGLLALTIRRGQPALQAAPAAARAA